MIDEQKIIGMLQAKALGCLDAEENLLMQNHIDEGHVFPWDELGKFENAASLLPLSLQLEIPDSELKDRVALKLIKLRDDLRAKKLLEEEKLEVEEDIQTVETIEALYVEPPIEIETEIAEVLEEQTSETYKDESSFNLDEIILPEYDSITFTDNVTEEAMLDVPVENFIEEPQIEIPQAEEVKFEEPIIIEEAPQKLFENEIKSVAVNESKQTEDPEESGKQLDLTKKSVAEKMFKAIEQDFDSLKFHFDESEKKLIRGLLLSYVIIAVLLALLAFSFFKFSSDIKSLENEVRDVKKKLSSQSLIYYQINNQQYFFS